jgi:hypothetical protein
MNDVDAESEFDFSQFNELDLEGALHRSYVILLC